MDTGLSVAKRDEEAFSRERTLTWDFHPMRGAALAYGQMAGWKPTPRAWPAANAGWKPAQHHGGSSCLEQFSYRGAVRDGLADAVWNVAGNS